MGDVTQILSKIEYGDPSAAEDLLPLIYDDLRALAAAKMSDESPDNTLQATALVHEAYVRLVDVDKAQHWNSRGHFFGAAAEAMRRILVESARRRNRERHGGNFQRLGLHTVEQNAVRPDTDVLAVDEALAKLTVRHPEKAQLVKLRYFAGLTLADAASAAGLPIATADRHWRYARAWLARELHRGLRDDSL